MKTLSILLSLLMLMAPLQVLAQQAAPAQGLDKEYPIAAGDVISINVFPAQEFSRDVTVQPDGSIEIPLLGSISTQGLKPSELEKILTAKYSRYVANPSITVSVRRFSFNRVAIIGQAHATGYYEYHEGMRLLDLVAEAGGLQDYASTSKVRIYRKIPGADGKATEEVFKANLEDVLNGDLNKNVPLVNGDIVYVPRKPYYAAGKWITDNMVPWTTLFLFALTAGIVVNKNR